MVVSVKQYKIPYGVCEIHNGGDLVSIEEKPEFDLLANTGMYLLSPEMIDLIPDRCEYHFTELIADAIKQGAKTKVFPISSKSWIDTGEWEEYKKAVQQLTI